jgi:hypothetical protein
MRDYGADFPFLSVAVSRTERDENSCRKYFTPSEVIAIGKPLESLEREEARNRQQMSGTLDVGRNRQVPVFFS